MPYSPSLSTRPDDFGVNNTVPVGGAVSDAQYRTIYDRPLAEMANLFSRHIDYVGFSTWLKAMGASRGVKTATTGHYEEPWKDDTIKVGSIDTAASGAGNDIVIVLDATNMYNTGATVSGASRQTSRVRQYEVYEFPGRIQAHVKSIDRTVSPHKVTLTPKDSTIDLDTYVLANGIAFSTGFEMPEGSSGVEGVAPRIIKYSNTFVIVKEGFKQSGTEKTNAVYFINDGNGTIDILIQANTVRSFERQRDFKMVFGQQGDNFNVLSDGLNIDVDITGTEGFVEFAYNYGNDDTYVDGNYDLSDLDDLGTIFEDERVTMDGQICAWVGRNLTIDMEEAYNNVLVNNLAPLLDSMIPDMGGYATNTPEYSAADFAMRVGYRAVHKSHYTYHYKKMPAFNDFKGGGATGHSYRDIGIYHPFAGNVEAVTKQVMPSVFYEYKEANGYSREFVVGELAGIGVAGVNTPWKTPTSTYDLYEFGMVCEIAPHFTCGNKLIVQEPQ